MIKCGEKVDKVEGEGVIGYYPEIFNGCDDFIYESCTNLEGRTGSFGGMLEFKDQ